MLWISGEKPSCSLERTMADITVRGMQFWDPVYVDMFTGYVHDLSAVVKNVRGGARIFQDVPIWDSPILIINKSALNIKTE